MKSLRWYFRTFADQTIRVVDLKTAVDAANGKVRVIKMGLSAQPIADSSLDFMSSAQAAGSKE
jgi:choloylglycine hydrolase